jgi:DNA polymerase III delta prime subunit
MLKTVNLIGQKNLVDRFLDLLEQDNVPHTMILVGPKGQGKKTFAKWLAEQLEAPVYVPEDLKIDSIREVISDSRTLSSPKLYLLADAEDMTIQAQNSLLKLAEEPPENAYIVITVESLESLLSTIISRSVIFRMEEYTIDELKVFTHNEDLIKLAMNPGMIKRLQEFDYTNLLNHAFKIVDNIGKISASNAFNILRSVDKDKYDFLIPMLIYAYSERMKEGLICTEQLRVLYETKSLLERSKSINVQNALEMMFIRLREAARNEVQRT